MDLVLAISKAGHDKGQTYVVVGENEDMFFLANGETKSVLNPKKKKKIHVQIIKKLPTEVIDIIGGLKGLDDISIKRILKVFNRRKQNV